MGYPRNPRRPGPTAPRRLLPVLATLVLVLTGPGCLFSPRDPEPPASGSAVDYLDQVNPSNVWDNLGKSLQNNDSSGWERNIGEVDFVYVPDSDAAAQFPGVFDTWGREEETDFIRKFYGFGTINTDVVMRNQDFNVPAPSPPEVQWEGVIYDFTVDTGGSLARYRGSADITFSYVGTEWFVTRWVDRQGESDPANPGTPLLTFGFLRGTTASN